MTQHTAHYVLSTHWDREWYQHFQDYRYRLVQLIDRILDGWKSGELAGPFQTDGQAILVEDYLEIRPERAGEVRQRASENRLVIGPWYVLPDEYLVSGEALVRNLQIGRTLARELGGKPSQAGFLCDMFGHNSQMPQILAGFGIRGAFIWRGTNLAATRLFRWRAPDGSEQLTYRFGWGGYCEYARAVRGAHQKNQPDNLEQMRANFESYLETETSQTPAQTLLLFDGGDHMEWDQAAYQVLLEQMDRADPATEVVHTSLDTYLDQLLREQPQPETVLTGELREPAMPPESVDRQWLIAGVLSSRVWIKQRNAACQAALTQWAEPFSALATLALGREYPAGFLRTAWKWLLQNHPHDSICGCSIDAVHEDMKYRFAQTEHIAGRLKIEALRALTLAAGEPVRPDELRVGIFNPLVTPCEEVVELNLDIPSQWLASGAEMGGFDPQPGIRIYTPAGEELPYQLLHLTRGQKRYRMVETGFPKGYQVDLARIALRVRVPALGYTILTVKAGEPGLPTRYPTTPGIAASERTLENQFLRVQVETNGSLTVTDKRSGQIYTRWLTFEDQADIGDGWNYGQAVNDQSFSSTASTASVAVLANGPLIGQLRVRTILEIPDEFDFERMERSTHFERVIVDSKITLRAGQDHLEVECTVKNNARDHRLRVLFPSGADASTYLADAPFDVIERPIALRADNHLYREMEVETKPQQTWTAVFDEQRGQAVISSGLLETAIRDVPERILALTLFRATRRTVFTNGEPEGQLQGDLHFRFWLKPLAGPPDRAALSRLGQTLEGGLGMAQATAADNDLREEGISLPFEGSLLAIAGPVVVTSVQRQAGGLLVRLFNPNESEVIACLKPKTWPSHAWTKALLVNFEDVPCGEPLRLVNGQVELEIAAKKIVTLQLLES